MHQYTCSVRLDGSTQHIVTGKRVTIPEIAVLRTIHGGDAVTDLAPTAPIERSDIAERERLRALYDSPTPDSSPMIDRLFGVHGALPRTLAAIGIDAKAAAQELRARAAAAQAAAGLLDGEAEAIDQEADAELAAFD